MKTSEAIEILEAIQKEAAKDTNDPAINKINEAVEHAIVHMRRFSWRPISEAPDETGVFVITESNELGMAIKHNGNWALIGVTLHYGRSNKPTHFMPLPDAPEVEG